MRKNGFDAGVVAREHVQCDVAILAQAILPNLVKHTSSPSRGGAFPMASLPKDEDNHEEDPMSSFPSHLRKLICDLNHGYQLHSPYFDDRGFCKPPLEWLLREGEGLSLDIAGNDSMALFYSCMRFFWQRNQFQGTLAQQTAVGFCWTVDDSFEIWRQDILNCGRMHF